MTPTEAGVRELCANTRESCTPAFALRCYWYASVFKSHLLATHTIANMALFVTRIIKMCDVD
ncbi:hypothetical protein DZA65_00327 [Dickeya dianthicola]|nr:hypothetical protein DZA65_00327 [Dickeya dianthicola]